MKTKLFQVPMVLLLLIATSCTEKVSDELQENNTTNNTTTTEVLLKFELSHTMGTNLSHFMHDAESMDDKCKIEASASGLDAENYERQDTDIAKDCFLEVEELDLYYQGAQLKLEVSEGMCEYVLYRPYSFWQYQPGTSELTVYQLSTDDPGCTDGTFDGEGGGIYRTKSGSDFTDSITSVNQACYFDHSRKANMADIPGVEPPNCDDGVVTAQQWRWQLSDSYDPDTDAPVDNSDCVLVQDADAQTECGGDVYNCLEGPAKEILADQFPASSGIIFYNEDLSAITLEEELKMSSPFEKKFRTNIYLANYMRSCMDVTSPDKSDSNAGIFDTGTFLGYENELIRTWPSASSGDTTASGAFVSTTYDYNGDGNNDYTPLATAPFRGDYSTKSYYGFYCLDKAFDIKAQIRLFIREWDRSFDQSYPYLAKPSDLNKAVGQKYMDTGTDAYDVDIPYNNISDWDDFLQSVYPEDWTVTTAGNQATMLPGMGANDESGMTRIRQTCEGMSSPQNEFNFPRNGL
jgi:hypothetical protein